MGAMEPTTELLDALRREEIRDARRLTVAQKLALGGDLFDMACEVTMCGIRNETPGITDDDALNELRRRLALGRRLESRQ